MFRHSLMLILLLVSMPAFATTYDSGSARVHLVELFTSEGCNSCPPADRWLSHLKTSDALWSRVVPLAFHVDYWDYLGWRDQMARPAFSARQRTYARAGRASGVYTPGVFLDGREWRNWRRAPVSRWRNNTQPAAGQLRINLDGRTLAAEFQHSGEAEPLTVYVAWLGTGISSDVTGGENRGKVLRHDFVVLGLQQLGMSQDDDGNYQASSNRMKRPGDETAVAAWVSNREFEVLQAVGGWLPVAE